MSGGVAYVLDENRRLRPARQRRWSASRKSRTPRGNRRAPRDGPEAPRLHQERARQQVLADWDKFVPKFVKVMPKDYKRMLACLEKAPGAGPHRRRSRHGRLRGKRPRHSRASAATKPATRTNAPITFTTSQIPWANQLASSNTCANCPSTARRLSASKDWKEFHHHMEEKKLRQQGARCMDCGVPFCHTGKLISGMAAVARSTTSSPSGMT
jgi:hypothetical protein